METTLRKIPIRLPEELAVRLEQEADGRPISRYVARLIEQALATQKPSRIVERKVAEMMHEYPAAPWSGSVGDALRELLRRLEAE